MVTVYTKTNCNQCRMVKRWLDEHSIEYVAKNIEHDLGALEEVKKFGFRSVPVTVSADQVIQGFAPNKLALIK